MRNRIALVVVAAVLALAGCRGHEAITGGYGSTGVSGVVSMAAGMTNNSPQGVRVAVSGTGMSAGLRPHGRLAVFRAPGNPTLTFSRGDVSASIKVQGSGVLQIELNATTASLSRHRATPSDPSKLEVEGLITNVTATEITVHDSHNQDVTATISDITIIRK